LDESGNVTTYLKALKQACCAISSGPFAVQSLAQWSICSWFCNGRWWH